MPPLPPGVRGVLGACPGVAGISLGIEWATSGVLGDVVRDMDCVGTGGGGGTVWLGSSGGWLGFILLNSSCEIVVTVLYSLNTF